MTENDALRIDAEHYKAEYSKIKQLLIKKGCIELKKLIDRPVMTGHTPSMKNESYYGGNVNFIKTDNLREHYIEGQSTDRLSAKGNSVIKRSSLKDGDVIVTIIGATFQIVGRACLIKDKDLPANINQNIALIRVSEKISPELLTVYLNSYYGRNYLWYLSRQTEQVNLNCREIEKILIPVFSKRLQSLIDSLHKQAYALYQKADLLFQDAEEIVLSELNLLNWKPKHCLSFVKSYSDTQTALRIDAEYFQPKYEELMQKLNRYTNGIDTISNIVKIKNKNFTPKSDATYKYIELANIASNGKISGFFESLGKELPTRARRKVNVGDVIVSSIEGSLSCIALIAEALDSALCSTGFYVINSNVINSETLLVLLKSKVGQLQLKKGCSGTILTAINNDEFSKIVIPKIPENIQDKIKLQISDMYKAKTISNNLLNIARKSVELAIEKSEKDAEVWIRKEVDKLGVRL